MAIKKAPITAAWQVNLYCDKCGEIMKFKRTQFPEGDNKLQFVYGCDCGHEEMTDQQYPHQIVHFDLSKMEVVIDG